MIVWISALLLMVVSLCQSCDDINQVSLMPPFSMLDNVHIKMNEDLTLICCHPSGARYLSWLNPNGEVISPSGQNGVFSVIDEKNRLILRLEKVNRTKLGTYKCTNSLRKLYRSIAVSERSGSELIPKVEKLARYFPRGSPIRLRCPLKSREVFKTWVYSSGGNNQFVRKAVTTKKFEISANRTDFVITAQPEQFERVWCRYNEVTLAGEVKEGMYEFSWTMYEPIDVRIEMRSKGVLTKDPITEGNNVSLTCLYNIHPLQAVQFPLPSKPSFRLDVSKKVEGQVSVRTSRISKDMSGIYRCVVTNFLSATPFVSVYEKAEINVEVLVPPKILENSFTMGRTKIGEKGVLSCKIKASTLMKEGAYFSKLNVTATDDVDKGRRISNSEGYNISLKKQDNLNILQLIIDDVQWSDRGLYACTAINAAGRAQTKQYFVVSRRPELANQGQPPTTIYLAMEPVIIDCFVSGLPVENSRDIVDLRLDMDQTSAASGIKIEEKERKRDQVEGLTVRYQVSPQSNIPEGTSYKLHCFYKNIPGKFEQTRQIVLKIASKPSDPKVEVLCSGSTGVALKLDLTPSDNENDEIDTSIIYYAPIDEFDQLTPKPSKTFLISKEDRLSHAKVTVVEDLLPDQVYKFKLEVRNKFRMSNNKVLEAKTESVAPPQTPTALQFSPANNTIQVNVTWRSKCPHAGVSSDIRDLIVKMRSLDAGSSGANSGSSQWQWFESNFTLQQNTNSLQFFIFLKRPQVNYEISVAVRSVMGTSEYKSATYRGVNVLSASLFGCFPKCGNSANTLTSDMTGLLLPVAMVLAQSLLMMLSASPVSQ